MLEKIKEIIANRLEINISEITEESLFMDDLGADSLDMFEFAMDLEAEYDIEIHDEDLEYIKTVGDVVEFLKKNGIEE